MANLAYQQRNNEAAFGQFGHKVLAAGESYSGDFFGVEA